MIKVCFQRQDQYFLFSVSNHELLETSKFIPIFFPDQMKRALNYQIIRSGQKVKSKKIELTISLIFHLVL